MAARQTVKRTHLIALALIALLGIIAYSNSIGGEFLWDDEYLIERNSYIKDPASIPEVFSHDIGSGSGRIFGFYRPIQIVTYMLDYKLWGLDPRGYHSTNILLHILTASSVYALIFMLFSNPLTALLTAVLFVICPLNVASVSYVSGRAELLYAIFTLLSLTLYIRSDKDNGIKTPVSSTLNIACASVLYVLALLSKEAALSLLLMIWIYHFSLKRPSKTSLVTPFLAITGAYIALRIFLLHHGTFIGGGMGREALLSAQYRIPGFFAAVWSYTKLLFAPIGLHMEYGLKLFSFTEARVIAGIIIFSAIIIAAISLRGRNSALSLAAMWLAILLVPISNIYPPLNSYMAEHWLYIPAIGAFLAAAYFIESLYSKARFRIAAIGLFLAIVAYYSCFTIQQNRYWHDPIVFYERTLSYAPDSVRAINDLARKLDSSGRSDESLKLYRRAMEIDPSYPLPYNNTGFIYQKNGQLALAAEFYQKAIALDPNYVDALNNLAVVYQRSGRFDEALALYKKVIAIHPAHAGAYNNMGVLYATRGYFMEAKDAYMRSLEIDPNLRDARINLELLSSHEKK